MRDQNWQRKEYESWDDAFRGLTPVIRQQSVRVAAYTQVLFVQACKLHLGAGTKDGEARMRGPYADLAYKCGMYHQLGKALVPPEYQVWQNDFTAEEEAVYRKYTADGRLLVATLQERSARAKDKRKGELKERPTMNIPWLMLREACEQHMERWDGSGYPAGRSGNDISPIAQIVGLAKELDRLASETKSETPFDIAYEALLAGESTAWSPELIAVLKAAKNNCYAVYQKYIMYTRTLPKTIPLIERRPDRVMGLKYRPMVSTEAGDVMLYEAIPYFGGVANQPGETESATDLRELFKRTNLVDELSWYFLYEAADTVVRMDNCKLDLQGLLLNMLPDFYLGGLQHENFEKLFVDQPIEKNRLLLTIPDEVFRACNEQQLENLHVYMQHGIQLVLDDYRPNEELPPERLKEFGFTYLRVAPDLYLSQETANTMNTLRGMGFTLLGGHADNPDALGWLLACGVACTSGTMTGALVDDDELVLDTLAREEFGPTPPHMPEPEAAPEQPDAPEDEDDDDEDDLLDEDLPEDDLPDEAEDAPSDDQPEEVTETPEQDEESPAESPVETDEEPNADAETDPAEETASEDDEPQAQPVDEPTDEPTDEPADIPKEESDDQNDADDDTALA